MQSLPDLHFPDFTLPFEVTIDASQLAVVVVHYQQRQPLAFFSKKLSPLMQLSSTYEQEMFAITEVVHKWRHYLLGHRFEIYTDQKSLKGFLKQNRPNHSPT
ncbi:hypothetical protein Sango_0643000 [Sesamum angolense]|uniref:Reverse transcriptase RNase H-like domain-containing protein n=1 Tax=Sesamum angolense TaxID=2727404 RepID=A0AAE1X6Y5_9LAMI|nr:hypothetical protein Sango_0643000 [Sesamum angolense]